MSKEENNQPLISNKSPKQDEILTKTIGKTIFAVTFYMSISIILVFLNRLVMSESKEKAGALFTSWYQFIVTYIIIIIISTFCQNVPILNIFPPIRYDFQTFVKVLPVCVTYLLQIGLNNKCLQFVSVSGYQVVRSLTILFNILLTYFILNQTTSLKAVLCCIGVIIGFFFGVEGEIGLTWKGCFYGVASSLFVALYSIVVKKTLKSLDNNEYVLIEYNTPIAIIAFIPLIYFNGEFEVLTRKLSANFWIMQTLAGVVGFLINIAIFININVTSPLTHNLAGTVKACIQTILAFYIFPSSEKMTIKKFIGTVMIIAFSGLYSVVRTLEMKAKNAAPANPVAFNPQNETKNKGNNDQEDSEVEPDPDVPKKRQQEAQ
ncbi:GDP-fucose transporter-related protein [Trichomonas vaginalis G3]|uniref:GDP-fucose transporter-related protein n=1 Tax=Trichomonas vaginalis (strain ATCC PRA-98 / G3) TaxID=412133 RepID=A2FLM2_TRIV3|nr:GDP-fucose import into Golgi lumen [Trichomonas vaginalis G3]EAX94195.1 GDP-fucose transporter-related protein [Trichomonas vaginalis G3]KAI5498404.1 GDP-fucose import into Golgi lumen [Trichomonas vaginalis G3]|eukprot:XP_001307125.1 GDP-fucose transporter-related protein [Trichomonas vaginalis G3]